MYDIEVVGDGHNHARLSFTDKGNQCHYVITTDAQIDLIRRLSYDLVFSQIDPFMIKVNIETLKRMVQYIELEAENKS